MQKYLKYILLIIILPSLAYGQTASKEYQKAFNAFNQNNYTDALSFIKKAIELKPDDKSYLRFAGMLTTVMEDYPQTIEFMEAYKSLLVKEIEKRKKLPNDLAFTYKNLSNIYVVNEQPEQAVSTLKELKTYLESDMEPQTKNNLRERAELTAQIGKFLIVSNDYEKAEQSLSEALKLYTEFGSPLNDETIDIKRSLAVIYNEKLDKKEKALPLYKEVLDYNIGKYGQNHIIVSRDYNTYGRVLENSGQLVEAVNSFHNQILSYLAYYNDLTLISTTQNVKPAFITYVNNNWLSLSANERALIFDQEAIKLEESQPTFSPLYLATLRQEYAAALSEKGDNFNAARNYSMALSTFEEKLGADHPYSINVKEAHTASQNSLLLSSPDNQETPTSSFGTTSLPATNDLLVPKSENQDTNNLLINPMNNSNP